MDIAIGSKALGCFIGEPFIGTSLAGDLMNYNRKYFA